MTSTKQGTLSRGDAGALIGFCIAGVAIAAYITVFSISRIIALLSGTMVPVLVEFVDQPIEAPLGANGENITLELDRASITVPSLPPVAIGAGILGQIAQIVTIVVVIGCLMLLARSILTGAVFSRRNTRLVMAAGIVGLVGFAAVQFFENMLSNAAVAEVTDNAVDNAVISIEPFTFVLAAFIISVIGTAFVIGDRLQRETEGLV
ncbi:DUF2975 domain-containing protein [Microbacterium saperdae]|uniref:DUF2975 family protein n=1 Tax=Microbacterium saperdae TaxID=69368 RepID=A0A543BIG4_9MICO|nr:DUF2975 domain-containing protein [Microbacterium saperdae]TQL84640.1 DUF2975 family protein [Microbacterium saperdae]GGM61902.1 hypothetical protein GCM10010489_36820 [Microbacterium saperdae]